MPPPSSSSSSLRPPSRSGLRSSKDSGYAPSSSANSAASSAGGSKDSSPPLVNKRPRLASAHSSGSINNPGVTDRAAKKKRVVSNSSNGAPSSSSAASSAGVTAGNHVNGHSNHHETREANIRVVVRCRGRSAPEIASNSPIAISTSGSRGDSVSLLASAPAASTSSSVAIPSKTYTFDHVFGPDADQDMLYKDVVQPIVQEVLGGYNCTIFAYGQTGTGKTYTMEGALSPEGVNADTTNLSFVGGPRASTSHNLPSIIAAGSIHPDAGVIPRVLHDLFRILERDRAEYTVRVSFVELYNEELRDLNSATDTPHSAASETLGTATTSGTGLRIYEDSKKSGVIIQGLEETLIASADEGIKVLQRGSQRRQVAATKCNDHSSRSHSVFSITLHLKETSPTTGEDLLKVGKLNLVDLAGSENVGRSGAEKGIRAREAGMINQSLLTLGRVINALVASSGKGANASSVHIPYRESKLTRLLQDSLGGRTKTCIIATISPAKVNLEETLSTLDYALKTKSIRNKPEVNQRMTKGALLGQYAQEIERLKADLLAAREKNGIFLSPDSWSEFSAERETHRTQLEEARRQADAWDFQLKGQREQLEQNLTLLGARESEVQGLRQELDRKVEDVDDMRRRLEEVGKKWERDRTGREKAEMKGRTWRDRAKGVKDDNEGLWAKLERKNNVETSNRENIAEAKSALLAMTSNLETQVRTFKTAYESFANDVLNRMVTLRHNSDHINAARDRIAQSSQFLESASRQPSETAGAMFDHGNRMEEWLRNGSNTLASVVNENSDSLKQRNKDLVNEAVEDLNGLLQDALRSFASLTNSFAGTVHDTSSRMQVDMEQLARMRESENQALQAEVADLKEQVRLLKDQQGSRQAARQTLRTNMISKLTAELDRYEEEEDRDVEMATDALRSNLENARRASEARSQRRLEVYGMIEGNGKATEGAIRTRQNDTRKEMDECTEALSTTFSNAQTRAQQRSVQLEDAINQGTQRLHQFPIDMTSACETYGKVRDELQPRFHDQYGDILQNVGDTYLSQQKDLSSTHSAMEEGTSKGLEQFDQFSPVSESFFVSSNARLQRLREEMSNYLQDNIRQDVSTGVTPQRRKWSSDADLSFTTDDSSLSELENSVLYEMKGSRPSAGVHNPPLTNPNGMMLSVLEEQSERSSESPRSLSGFRPQKNGPGG